MSDADNQTPTGTRKALIIGALLLIVGMGSFARFTGPGLIEYKGDEAVAVALAMPMVEGEALPKVGLMSSVGVHNPPLFIWLTALPLTISTDPRFVTAGLVGGLSVLTIILGFLWFRRRLGVWTALFAMAFYATSTWSVLYARKIWAQNVLPIFSLATLHVLFLVWERPKTRWVALGPVLLCALWQIHFSAFAVILISAGLCLWRWRQLNWPWLGGGMLVAIVMLWPYVDHQRTHNWEDVEGMRNVASGKRADGTIRESKREWTLAPVRWATYITAGTKLDYALGQSEPAFDGERKRGGFVGAGRILGTTLLAVGTLLLLGLIGLGIWRRRTGALAPKRHAAHVIVAWWVLGYLALFIYVRFEHVYPHYFTMMLPVPFFLMAMPLGLLADRFGAKGIAVSVVIVGLFAAAHLSNLASFRTFVTTHGGTKGDYGVVYEAKDELTAWMTTHGLQYARVHGWEYGFMLKTAREYADMDAMADRVSERPAPPPGRKRVNVYNSLWDKGALSNQCPGRQAFGPLVVCPVR